MSQADESADMSLNQLQSQHTRQESDNNAKPIFGRLSQTIGPGNLFAIGGMLPRLIPVKHGRWKRWTCGLAL